MMTLEPYKSMRRCLLHVAPVGFRRICHNGLPVNAGRKGTLRGCVHFCYAKFAGRWRIGESGAIRLVQPTFADPCCGAATRIIECSLNRDLTANCSLMI
jgi:hypothetical protein